MLLPSNDPAAILLLIAVALLVLFFFLKGSADLPKLADQAETARRQGRAAEAEKVFAALSSGGNVQMPLTKTFFSPRFGMLADKFGVSWMIYVAPKQ